jgi:hypothetical protein
MNNEDLISVLKELAFGWVSEPEDYSNEELLERLKEFERAALCWDTLQAGLDIEESEEDYELEERMQRIETRIEEGTY